MFFILLVKAPRVAWWCLHRFFVLARSVSTLQVLFLVPVVVWLLWMPRLFDNPPAEKATPPVQQDPPPAAPDLPALISEPDSGHSVTNYARP